MGARMIRPLRTRPTARTVTRRTRTGLAVAAVLGLLATSAPAAAAPGPPAYPAYWFDEWGINALWARGVQGAGMTVAIIDTGVQSSVSQLSANVVAGTDLTGLGGDGTTDRAKDSFSHGTAMASLIVARGGNGYVTGVAPQARIMPIAVPLGETVNSRPGADETAPAIRWAADHGAKIISMSFGGEPNQPSADSDPCPADTQAAVFYALRKGAILVASGGNSGEQGSPVEEPGVCLGVLAVAAVDSSDAHASFSSVHPYLSVSAPGVNVTTLNRDGDVFVGAGTSQAAALTAGALALIWSAHPSENNRSVLARLMGGLRRPAGSTGRDPSYGYGIVDADQSVDTAPTSRTPNPVFASADPFLGQLAVAPDKLTPPAAAATSPPSASGSHRDPVTRLSGPEVGGISAAGLALLALLALLVGGFRSRRRARLAGPATAPAPQPPWAYPAPDWGHVPPGYWQPQPQPQPQPPPEPRAEWEIGLGDRPDPPPAT